MPTFFYKAKSSPDKIIQGSLEAQTQAQAINKLISQGYFPVSIEEASRFDTHRPLFLKKSSSRDIYIFTHQLSSLIGSGLNLLNALNTILEQTQNKYLKSILSDVASKIRDGKSFSDALSNWPSIFSNLYISMIRSAEVGGNLEDTLNHLTDYYSKEQELRANIRGALTYPFFIAIIGFLTIYILLGFVIPRLIVMFEDMGQTLPLPTRILIGLSNLFKHYWWLILVTIFIIIFIFMRRFKDIENRIALDRLKLKLPFIGEVIQKIEISRFCRSLSTLLFSGVPIVSSLEITEGIINNVVIKQDTKRLQDEIKRGLSLSESIKNSKYFPIFMINIVSIGEEAGTLEKSLLRVSDEYSKEVDQRFRVLTRLLEPAVILIMGLIVGFIVIAMLLPIFQINLIVR